MIRLIVLTVATALLAACNTVGPSGPPGAGNRITVATTTTVLADLVGQVGGERVSVHSLVPRGTDVHTFDPTPADAQRVAGAQLMVMNGLGLDDWLERIAANSGGTRPIVRLAEDLDGATYIDDNPHLWLDVANARLYVGRIADELSAVDPPGRPTYEANAAAYDLRLLELDGWIRGQLGALPAASRRVVSFHDAFPYFAAAYGIEIVGVVVASPGQEPSAGELARLVEAIRQADARAILGETQFSDRLATVIAQETGARVVNGLYTDALGDPPLDTYEAALRHDVIQIMSALE